MDRRRMSGEAFEKLRLAAGKYKYALAAALLGAVLMLLPSGGKKTASAAADAPGGASVRAEMETVLGAFDGVGRLRLMLTVEPGTERWEGAVVVCEGGGSAAVRLELTQAVRALTGLPADRISIVKGKP